MTETELFKQRVPSVLIYGYIKNFARMAQEENHLSENYLSWNGEIAASTGYNFDNILEKQRLPFLK